MVTPDPGPFGLGDGVCPILENSTACQKSMPMFLPRVGAGVVLSGSCVAWGVAGLGVVFILWLMRVSSFLLVVLAQSVIFALRGFFLKISTESLILAQDERWRRA